MTLEQESRINQFILFLFRCIEERKKLFEAAGCEDFGSYRAVHDKLPAIVVFIDNYFALSETYESIDSMVNLLAREGTKYGIYIVATATNAALVRYKFSINFKMALCLQLIEKGEYDGIVGRTEGLEPAHIAGRGLVRGKPPLEFQAALPQTKEYDTERLIEISRLKETCSAISIPIMPAKINIQEINKAEGKLAIGLSDNELQPVYLDLGAAPVLMVAGDAMSGKSTLLVSWIKMMKHTEVYALDSIGMGLYEVMDMSNVTDLSKAEDSFIDGINAILDERRSHLNEYRRSGANLHELIGSWKQILFVIDRLKELTDSSNYPLKELLERIVKTERGMKVAVIAADNTSELASNWDSLGKAIREEQTGILLGSIKEQGLFSAKIPYGMPEKDIEFGDGYLIVKNKFTGLRVALFDRTGEAHYG